MIDLLRSEVVAMFKAMDWTETVTGLTVVRLSANAGLDKFRVTLLDTDGCERTVGLILDRPFAGFSLVPLENL